MDSEPEAERAEEELDSGGVEEALGSVQVARLQVEDDIGAVSGENRQLHQKPLLLHRQDVSAENREPPQNPQKWL